MNERDAIFLTNAVQIEFLQANAEIDLELCWKIPLSMQAHGLLLRQGFARVKSHFEFVDFEDCKHWYLDEGLRWSKDWLRELGLGFEVEGIDVADLDAPCQFLLFTHLRTLERTAERIIAAMPEIKRFFAVQGREPLEHEFYFDSDVAAGVLGAVCERLGRSLEVIKMGARPRYLFPSFSARPMSDASVVGPKGSSKPPFKSADVPRIGFAPATVANAQSIFESLAGVRSQVVVFGSVWEHGLSPGQAEEFQLSSADGDWSEDVSSRLAKLYGEFDRRRNRSSLPDAIVRNRHLNFQFEYIIRRRWRAYANMIHRGKRLVRDVPLELFIHSDHFTGEGAVLSRLYRREGTPVLISLHSKYPCDRNWASWDCSDRAMTPSRSAGARLREISGMREVTTTGDQDLRRYRSLRKTRSREELFASKSAAVGNRKVVLVLTNALELDCVPFVDLKAHFEAMSLIAKVADALQDRVAVVLRTKPGWFGEDPILYEKLSGFTPARFRFLEEASFSESVQVADCIVGVNLPTTGYYEILQRGAPLIHLQTAEVVSRQPDLPADVVMVITEPEALRPAIEAILFSQEAREEVVRKQREFAENDLQPNGVETLDPVKTLVESLIKKRPAHPWWPFRRTKSKAVVPSMDTAPTRSSLRLSRDGGAGFVDDILYSASGGGSVSGWAGDLRAGQKAKAIHLFQGERWLAEGKLSIARPDVAAAYGKQGLLRSGFSVPFQLASVELVHELEVYAQLGDDSFYLLSRSFETVSTE